MPWHSSMLLGIAEVQFAQLAALNMFAAPRGRTKEPHTVPVLA